MYIKNVKQWPVCYAAYIKSTVVRAYMGADMLYVSSV